MANIQVRNVDGQLWRRVGAQAKLRGVPVGALLTEILKEWLARQAG